MSSSTTNLDVLHITTDQLNISHPHTKDYTEKSRNEMKEQLVYCFVGIFDICY